MQRAELSLKVGEGEAHPHRTRRETLVCPHQWLSGKDNVRSRTLLCQWPCCLLDHCAANIKACLRRGGLITIPPQLYRHSGQWKFSAGSSVP